MPSVNPSIAKVVFDLPVNRAFDYLIKEELRDFVRVGQRVAVLFNRRSRLGYVVDLQNQSEFKRLQSLSTILDDESPCLDANALQLTRVMSDYYGCSWGEAIDAYLPAALRKTKSIEAVLKEEEDFSTDNMLIAESKVDYGTANARNILLLARGHDQRWANIQHHIAQCLARGKSVIFLVPETESAKDVHQRLMCDFSSCVIFFDRSLTPKQELQVWLRIKTGSSLIVVGTRSAIFAPLKQTGLIVVYDEEKGSYKQEQSPYYHARDVAVMRSKIDNCRVLWASCAPSVELWYQAQADDWQFIHCESNVASNMQLVDMNNYNPARTSIMSFPLQNEMQKCLDRKEKIILFHNRKGFSTWTHCQRCGHTLRCERCDVNLMFKYSTQTLVCRHCQLTKSLPKKCPECHTYYLKCTGTGLEKLRSEVARYHPQARIAIYEKESVGKVPDVDILLCTVAVLRWKEELKASLVGVINFDRELNFFDFRCAQRAFALLVYLQMMASDKLMIQTRLQDHYIINALKKMNFADFYQEELQLRKECLLPPYSHLIAIGLRGNNEDDVVKATLELYSVLEADSREDVEVIDSHPDGPEKLRAKFRSSLTLRGPSVPSMVALAKEAVGKIKKKKGIIISVNVDP